tara:strand:- start:17681 stop:17944 length:264 start_codon:yes stop_codon:yes gene_type:complete
MTTEKIVFWQPDTGRLPVLVGELLPESGGEVAGSRRVKRWGRVEQVEEHLLRGPGAEAAVEARLRRNPEALAALEAFAKSELVAVKV